MQKMKLDKPENGESRFPWKPDIQSRTGETDWHIINCITRKRKKIGPAGNKRTNYYGRACEEASRRNEAWFQKFGHENITSCGWAVEKDTDEWRDLVMEGYICHTQSDENGSSICVMVSKDSIQ